MRAMWAAVAAVSVVGCAPTGDRTGTVAGRVTVDGKAAEGVVLTFAAADGRVATARTDPAGEYCVRVPVGPATVTAYTPGSGEAAGMAMKNRGAASPDQRAREGGAKKPPPAVPPRYADPSSSGLRYTVPDGDSRYDIPLRGK